MGKDSVCWSWDERLKKKGRKSYTRHCGLRNQMFSLSCALFNDESPLVSWKLFYFKNCPHFHKESLRHTQHYTVKRTITVERNWFNPFKQMKTTSQLDFPSLPHWSAGTHCTLTTQGGVMSGQISLFPKWKQWCGIQLHGSLLHCMLKIFPRGTLGAYRAYFSGPQLKNKQQTNK